MKIIIGSKEYNVKAQNKSLEQTIRPMLKRGELFVGKLLGNDIFLFQDKVKDDKKYSTIVGTIS